MHKIDQAYAEGFMAKCASRGIDPEAILKAASDPLEMMVGKPTAHVLSHVPGTPEPKRELPMVSNMMPGINNPRPAPQAPHNPQVPEPPSQLPGWNNPTPQHPAIQKLPPQNFHATTMPQVSPEVPTT